SATVNARRSGAGCSARAAGAGAAAELPARACPASGARTKRSASRRVMLTSGRLRLTRHGPGAALRDRRADRVRGERALDDLALAASDELGLDGALARRIGVRLDGAAELPPLDLDELDAERLRGRRIRAGVHHDLALGDAIARRQI